MIDVKTETFYVIGEPGRYWRWDPNGWLGVTENVREAGRFDSKSMAEGCIDKHWKPYCGPTPKIMKVTVRVVIEYTEEV